jgi:hypothetical protein
MDGLPDLLFFKNIAHHNSMKSLSTPAVSESIASTANGPSAENDVIAVAMKRYAAYMANDRDLYASLLHDGYQHFGLQGEIQDKATFLNAVFGQRPATLGAAPRLITVVVEGDVATVGYEIIGNVTVNDRDHSGAYQLYYTLQKIEGEWLFVAGNSGQRIGGGAA